LTYLKRFPVDALKIDRAFVDGLGDPRNRRGDRAIVAGVIDVAHAFGLTTIAEGAQTRAQVLELQALGCEQAQGFYWSPALSATDTLAWMRKVAANSAAVRARSDGPAFDAHSTRVLVVDDDRAVRRLARLMLDTDPDFEVVGEAEDGRQAVALARHHQPDVVLLDLAMPGVGGLEALPLILAVAPDAKVVVLSALDAEDVASRAHEHGALGFIQKGGDPEDVVNELQRILARAG
jgi:CheY-like chemotaxis protein